MASIDSPIGVVNLEAKDVLLVGAVALVGILVLEYLVSQAENELQSEAQQLLDGIEAPFVSAWNWLTGSGLP